MDDKEDKLVGLGAGRCQQKFTCKCEKQEVEIFHNFGKDKSRENGIIQGTLFGNRKIEDRKQRGWMMLLHGRD